MTMSFVKQWLKAGCGAAAVVAVLAPEPAAAQIMRVSSGSDSRNAIGFNLGYFSVKGEDSRGDDDVLFNDLDSLLFDIKDFNGAPLFYTLTTETNPFRTGFASPGSLGTWFGNASQNTGSITINPAASAFKAAGRSSSRV